MHHTHITIVTKAKRIIASALTVAIFMQHATPALAITFDSATSTYFDVIDDFGLASGGTSIGLQFGGTLGEYLRFDQALGKFVFTDDLDVQGTISGSALTVMGGNSYVLGKFGIGTSATPDALLEVAGTISGSSLKITGTAAISGTLVLEGSSTLSGAALRGFGLLADCDNSVTSKLLWDSTTGRFSCGTDQSGAGGLSLSDADSRYVNTAGDTMTGSLVVRSTGSFLGNVLDTGDIVLTVRGVSGQSGNLQEWQDSTGAPVANITAGGHLYAQYGNFSSEMSTTYANVMNSLNVSGNAILGDNSSDTISFNGQVNTAFLPNANAQYNIGDFSNYWNYGYFTNLNVTSAVNAGNINTYSLQVNGTANCNGGNSLVTDISGNVYCAAGGADNWGSGYFNISDGTTSEGIYNTDHILFADGTGINAVVSGTDTVTISSSNLYANDMNQNVGTDDSPQFAGLNVTGTSTLGDDPVSDSLIVNSVAQLNGHVALGSNATDSIMFNGLANTSILNATNNTYDIGNSGNRWATGFFNNLNTSGSADFNANVSVGGVLTLGSGDGNVYGNITPYSDLTFDLGSVTKRWRAAYLGSANVYGVLSGVTLYATKSFSGAGLSDCDNATNSKLLWDATTGRFSCGTDQAGGSSGGTYTAGQGLSLNGTTFSLGQTISGTLLEFQTVSGATVYAERQLSVSGSVTLGEDAADNVVFNADVNSAITPNTNSSFDFGSSSARWATGWFNSLNISAGISVLGTSSLTGNVGVGAGNSTTKAVLAVTGTISGATVYATRSFSGAGLSDCDAGTSKLLWDATTGRFSCGTITSTTYTAGQGLSLNGASSFSLRATVTGATVRAMNTLASSGVLIVDDKVGASPEELIIAKSVSSEASQVFLNATTGQDKDSDGFYFGNYHNPAFLVNRESSSLWFGTSGIAYAGINSSGNMFLGNAGAGGWAGTEVQADAKLEVVGTISGTSINTNSFYQGTGLSDCDTAGTSKLLWDATTGHFSCGTDQTGGSSGGGLDYATASGIFLKRSGGTMTGSIFLSSGSFIQTPGANPRTMSGIDLNANVNNVFISGNYVYTVSDAVTGNEFRSIDISNPNAPVIVGGFETGQNTKAMFVSTRHAFIGMNGTGAGSGMFILDNSNPGAPTLVSRINFGSAVNSIYISGKYAYVGLNAKTTGVCAAQYQNFGGCDFALVDFSDVVRPRIISGLQIGANVNQIYVQNRFAYLALDSVSGNDFRIVDMANPLSPVNIGGLDVSNNVKSVYATGKYAFIGLSTDASTEFRVIDITNKSSPSSITGVEFGTTVESVVVSGDWARLGLTSVTGNDYVTVDLRAPTTPSVIGGANYGADVNSVAVGGKYAYVALNSVAGNDMRIVDLAGIESPAASIGTLAAGSLFASDNVRFDNNAYIRNALNVGRGGIISKGALSVQATGTGSTKANTGSILNAFDVRNGTGQHLFSVSENGTVQAGLPSFSTGTMMIALNMMSRRSGYCTPLITSATTYTSVGMSTCTVNGTATAWPVGGRMKLKLAAANTASAMAGITTVFTETRPQFRPKIMFDVTTGTGTTGTRFYGGIVESSTAALAATVTSAATTIDYAALVWDDGISATQWLCCSGDGTNHSCQSMGVPVQTNTEYMGVVDWSQPGKVTCQLQVKEKTYRLTKTTNISVNNVSLGENVVIVNKSIGGAVSRAIYNSRLVLEQN